MFCLSWAHLHAPMHRTRCFERLLSWMLLHCLFLRLQLHALLSLLCRWWAGLR